MAAASAQTFPGNRAAGMAGAFVAVADDATAVFWNPAGVASGSIVSAVVDIGAARLPIDGPQAQSMQRDTTAFVGLAATALGAAYYRRGTYGSVTVEPAVTGPQSREDLRRSVQAVTTSTAGVSLVHSLHEHLVIGATPKFVHGAEGYTVDVDAGAMWWIDRVRVGVVARNLTRPSFAKGTAGRSQSDEIELDREVTVGAAWGSGWTGISRVIVSVDADVTSRAALSGDRRDVAAGVETWWRGQRLGLRGGLRRSTIGDARAAFAAGISAGLRPGMLLEAHVMRGDSDARSWGVGARMSF
ncbi:MAG TPA: conjugal transfer protein TraF [Vicinamibacterales bacterium]|nr:conjugal transfer protein TraF [Vicinamibacterales bacterium]